MKLTCHLVIASLDLWAAQPSLSLHPIPGSSPALNLQSYLAAKVPASVSKSTFTRPSGSCGERRDDNIMWGAGWLADLSSRPGLHVLHNQHPGLSQMRRHKCGHRKQNVSKKTAELCFKGFWILRIFFGNKRRKERSSSWCLLLPFYYIHNLLSCAASPGHQVSFDKHFKNCIKRKY